MYLKTGAKQDNTSDMHDWPGTSVSIVSPGHRTAQWQWMDAFNYLQERRLEDVEWIGVAHDWVYLRILMNAVISIRSCYIKGGGFLACQFLKKLTRFIPQVC
jgi:hypothetical protein